MLLNVANHGSIWLFKNLQKIHGANEKKKKEIFLQLKNLTKKTKKINVKERRETAAQ